MYLCKRYTVRQTLSDSQHCALVQLPVSLCNWAVRPAILFGYDFLLTCCVWQCPHTTCRVVRISYVPVVGTWMALRRPLFSATQQALSSDHRSVQSTRVELLGFRSSCSRVRLIQLVRSCNKMDLRRVIRCFLCSEDNVLICAEVFFVSVGRCEKKKSFKLKFTLTLNLLTWRIWWAPNNASKFQMGFNSTFKGLICKCFTGNAMRPH